MYSVHEQYEHTKHSNGNMAQNILNALVAQADWAILLLRIALGVIFIVHGFAKIKDFPGTVVWFNKWGFKPGSAWAVVAMVTQLLGGLFILVGFLTAPTCIILAIEMLIATGFNIKRKDPFFKSLELDIILLASLLLLATLGNGYFAISGLTGF